MRGIRERLEILRDAQLIISARDEDPELHTVDDHDNGKEIRLERVVERVELCDRR